MNAEQIHVAQSQLQLGTQLFCHAGGIGAPHTQTYTYVELF